MLLWISPAKFLELNEILTVAVPPFGIRSLEAFAAVQPHETSTRHHRKEEVMGKYRCVICDYVYDPAEGDPANGIAPGTPFAELPDDWACPLCGADKSNFEPI